MDKSIIVKKEQVEPSKQQQNYYSLDYDEKQLQLIEDLEKFYLFTYRKICELIQNNELKIYSEFPSKELLKAGACFVLQRYTNSALDRIIANMHGSRFYRCEKGKVQGIGQLVYLDGYLRFDKRLGIRIVRVFSKSQKLLNQELLEFQDKILAHIYVRDIQENGNMKQMCLEDVYNKRKSSNDEDSLSNYEEQEDAINNSDDQIYNLPHQKQLKLNQQSITRYQARKQDLFKDQSNGHQQQLNEQAGQKENLQQPNLFFQQIDQQNQQKEQQIQQQGQQEELKQTELNDDLQKQKNNQKKIENDQIVSQGEQNDMQEVIYSLFMENNELNQKLIQIEISQKKEELLKLEQQLKMLIYQKEQFQKQPNSINANQIYKLKMELNGGKDN